MTALTLGARGLCELQVQRNCIGSASALARALQTGALPALRMANLRANPLGGWDDAMALALAAGQRGGLSLCGHLEPFASNMGGPFSDADAVLIAATVRFWRPSRGGHADERGAEPQ